MSKADGSPGLSRRKLLAGIGLAATGGFNATAGAVPLASVTSWDVTTDVLVFGSGAAGACAAIESRQAGAEVLLIEPLRQFGGSSAMSSGVVYAGGGTALQRALGVEDSVEDMYNFLAGAGRKYPPLDKIRLYCEQSAAHFDWLVAQGVPYSHKLATARGTPEGEESLYFSGCELAWPARDIARPAPRGHVPGMQGKGGGRILMSLLIARLRELGVNLRSAVAGQQLVVSSDGRVAGMLVSDAGERKAIRARRGVVLAGGGFIHNREMVRDYAPALYDCGLPRGRVGDDGTSIRMGIAAGAAALGMDQGIVLAPLDQAVSLLSGIVVNAFGQRFVSEDTYAGVLGNEIAYHQQGRAWLLTDGRGDLPGSQLNFPRTAQANTIGDLAEQMAFPRGALQHSVAYYNRHAENGDDPLFRKSRTFVRPLLSPPFQAWDLSVASAPLTAHTLGGLQTTVNGRVINAMGEPIPGLYAAGRSTAGLPGSPYLASGLSLGDSSFFGRQAGMAAARDPG